MALTQINKLAILQCVSLVQSLQSLPDLDKGIWPVLDDIRSRLERIANGSPLRLTEHFTLEEFLASPTAVRHGITLYPNAKVFQNLTTLCNEVLEPARCRLNCPIYVSSGYRNQSLNRLVGGVPTSLHLEGRAADISCSGGMLDRLFEVLSTLPHTELIKYNSFIHVAL